MNSSENYSNAVIEAVEKEKQLGLYSFLVLGFPLWHIFMYRYRGIYVLRKTGIPPMNNYAKFKLNSLVNSYFKSAFQLIKLICSNTKYENVIFGFPRIEKVNNVYLDKFFDPLINKSNLKSSYIYFERGRSGVHLSPRMNNERIIYTEFIDFTSQFIGYLISPFILLRFLKPIYGIYSKAANDFGFKRGDFFKILFSTSTFIIKTILLKLILERLHCKRFFGTALNIFKEYIIACKKINIPVYELQHGITMGETVMYSGEYDSRIQPDFFLTFGESSMKQVFSVPKEKMRNIGWAFKSYILDFIPSNIQSNNVFLVISDWEITENIINTTIELSIQFPEKEFHIRLHPMERINSKQGNLISQFGNIKLQDNSINSNVALMMYQNIVGENSTVLYEALSIGKKVGRFCFNGFSPTRMYNSDDDGFYYIKDIKDFDNFIKWENKLTNNNNIIYSEFNVDLFNSILTS